MKQDQTCLKRHWKVWPHNSRGAENNSRSRGSTAQGSVSIFTAAGAAGWYSSACLSASPPGNVRERCGPRSLWSYTHGCWHEAVIPILTFLHLCKWACKADSSGFISPGVRSTRRERMACSARTGVPATLRTLAAVAPLRLHLYRWGKSHQPAHEAPAATATCLCAGREAEQQQGGGKSQGQTLILNVFRMTCWKKLFLKTLASVFLVHSGDFKGVSRLAEQPLFPWKTGKARIWLETKMSPF